METQISSSSLGSADTENQGREPRSRSTESMPRRAPVEASPTAEEPEGNFVEIADEHTESSYGAVAVSESGRAAYSSARGGSSRSALASPSPLNRQLLTYRSDIDECYEEERARNIDAQGVLQVSFDIEAHEAIEIEFRGMETEMHDCVRERMNTWRFPDTDDLEDVEENYVLRPTEP